MTRKFHLLLILALILLPVLAACQPESALPLGATLPLGSVTENYVEVSIALHRSENDTYTLTATFTPLEAGLHLYSKDIPTSGVDGLGRPTLLSLPADSLLVQVGGMLESQTAQEAFEGPSELRVYPEGPITLSMPVLLPEGEDWLDQQVLVTYMTCSDLGCRAPVENKVIAIRIPAKGLVQ
ncbi:MAG: hypothetical protein ACOY0R_04775 [Chloroflexota bacterium]